MHVYVMEPSPEFTRIGQRERSGHNHEITHPTADPAQCSFDLIKLSDGKWLPSLHLLFMLLVLADYSGAVFYA